MNLTQLAHHQHPRPRTTNSARRRSLDSQAAPSVGVDNLYVDDDTNLPVRGCLYNEGL